MWFCLRYCRPGNFRSTAKKKKVLILGIKSKPVEQWMFSASSSLDLLALQSLSTLRLFYLPVITGLKNTYLKFSEQKPALHSSRCTLCPHRYYRITTRFILKTL